MSRNGRETSSKEPGPKIFPFEPWDIKLFENDLFRLYYCIAMSRGYMYLRAIGRVLSDEYHRFRMATFQDEAWQNGIKTLADMRWVEDSLSFDKMSRYVKRAEAELARINIYPGDLAIVTKSDLSYGSSRMYELLSDQKHREIITARTLQEAAEFLNIDQANLDLIISKIDELEKPLQ